MSSDKKNSGNGYMPYMAVAMVAAVGWKIGSKVGDDVVYILQKLGEKSAKYLISKIKKSKDENGSDPVEVE